jgi:hypothetical protein
MSVTTQLQKLKQIKAEIAEAIIDKGVTVSDSDPFRTYSEKIESISQGSGEKPIPIIYKV